VPLDEAAAEAVRARGRGEVVAWAAAVGGGRPVRTWLVSAVDGAGGLSTPEVAAAVDRGRDAAGAAAGEGVTVLAARGANADAAALAAWLLGDSADPEIRGPLGALRRLGTAGLCELTGLALGCGEHALGLVVEGRAAGAGAAIAVAVEPELLARVRAADGVAASFGFEALVDDGGLEAALRALERV
jgi:hypothetical protein